MLVTAQLCSSTWFLVVLKCFAVLHCDISIFHFSLVHQHCHNFYCTTLILWIFSEFFLNFFQTLRLHGLFRIDAVQPHCVML